MRWHVTTPGWLQDAAPRLALVGNKGVGKTTIAAELVNEGWVRLSFAWLLKEGSMDAINAFLATLPRDYQRPPVTLAEMEAHKDVFRPLWQWLGKEFGRDYVGPEDIWTLLLQDQLSHYSLHVPLVVDDCRFLNEAAMLREEGFALIRVLRPDADNTADLHPSETELRAIVCDGAVENTGTIIQTVDLIQQALARLGQST